MEVEKSKCTIDQMFTKFLKPIGGNNATHCWCPRIGYNNQLEMQVERMASYKLDWIGKIVYTIDDDKQELLSKFVCMTTESKVILETLNLELSE